MSNPNVSPLAQDFVIAAQVPDPVRYFFHDPDLARLDDGTLLLAAPQWHRPGWEYSRRPAAPPQRRRGRRMGGTARAAL